MVAGAYSGDVYLWKVATGEVASVIAEAHKVENGGKWGKIKGPANALAVNGNTVISAGKDNMVHFWSDDITQGSKPVKSIDLAAAGTIKKIFSQTEKFFKV